jgi:hypothetical protein
MSGTKKMRGIHIAIAICVLAVLAAVGYFAYAGLTVPGADMPAEGYVALIIGIVFSLAVGVGLMALLFYSSRRGYDEPPRYK